ncbi:MAG: class I SAM-dependent methyltransferase [Candidatus Sericytochromatia bacterium]
MEWTDNFFGKYYLKTHFPVLTEDKNKQQVDFITNVLALPEKANILDAPCGHGRHSILLAKQGFEVTGIDFKEEFIDIAKENSKELNNTNFILQDIRKINFEEKFDAIINMFTSFGYFSDKENLELLQSYIKALKKGGKLLIDVINREWAVKNIGKISRSWLVYPEDNITFLASNSFDIFTGRMRSEQIIMENFVKFEQFQDIRLYSYTELKTLLGLCGAIITESYGNFEYESYNMNSDNMIIIAEKL